MIAPLRAPFPWFGGKSRVSHLVWSAFGASVSNYVEPFAGSLAVLLARPSEPRIETVNDKDGYLVNFWRAVQQAPEQVAKFADWPVSELDLHARHRWLVNQEEFRERMRNDPEYFDAKIAGWWVWGLCQWIGSGWCAESNWAGAEWRRSNAGRRARGIQTAENKQRPDLTASRGVQRMSVQMPMLRGDSGAAGAAGAGIHASALVRNQLPDLGGNGGAAGKGVHASAKSIDAIVAWMIKLQHRLRRVRICCGDWKRVLGRSSTELIGVTGIFLDPPYKAEVRDPSLYGVESADVSDAVREWAIKHGGNKRLRIAVCGYEGEHEFPGDWQCIPWKAAGGYAAAAGNTENSAKERIWFSPWCERAEDQADLFASMGGAA